MRRERIAKIMANRGLCSRREAERLMEAGQVLVGGAVVREQGCKAPLDADIRIAPEGEARLRCAVTVVLHKPIGIVSTQPEKDQVPAWRLLRTDNCAGRIDPQVMERVLQAARTLSVAGRLDRASRGLLILTQDGATARRIIGGHGVEKSYIVRTAEAATEPQVRKLNAEMSLDGRQLLPMKARRVAKNVLHFVLVEGRKHQIRRVCRKLGLTVTDLLRDAVGPIRIGRLPEGQWRLARESELAALAGRAESSLPRPRSRERGPTLSMRG